MKKKSQTSKNKKSNLNKVKPVKNKKKPKTPLTEREKENLAFEKFAQEQCDEAIRAFRNRPTEEEMKKRKEEMKKKMEEMRANAKPLDEKEINNINGVIGRILGMAGQSMLNAAGHDVDFRINGENINDIEKLEQMDIQQKLDLAIKEQRYEDAARFRDILKKKSQPTKEEENKGNA